MNAQDRRQLQSNILCMFTCKKVIVDVSQLMVWLVRRQETESKKYINRHRF